MGQPLSHIIAGGVTYDIKGEAKPYSFVGMIVESTTLNTEAKVKAIYGSGTSWIQHSGYMLRGATSGVTSGTGHNVKDGGSDNAVIVNHTHKCASSNTLFAMGGTSQIYSYYSGSSPISGTALNAINTSNPTDGESGTNKNIPNYKSVYIWERIS